MTRNIQKFIYFFWGMLLLPMGSALATDTIEICELKAAFIYNFTLFVTWPKNNNYLRMCVLGESTYFPQMKTYEGRSVNGATIRIERVTSADDARGCQVLLIGESEQDQINSITKKLKDSPVLTISESGNFSPDAVHILLTRHLDRMAFDINQTAAKASGLSFSFKMLKLARNVY